ncbi:LON peptidase substrate-binding domain-containing protein [soil metagenome]
MAVELAVFPLGAVLMPHMPLPLRIFEDRYLIMLSRILQQEPSEFGVVLIERGQESGGGETRFSRGTVARVVDLQGDDGAIGLMTRGGRRFEVTEWLADDPYPRAMVEFVGELEWDDALVPLLERTDQTVRRTLALASEYADQTWPSDIELSDDPEQLAWQLAAIAPLAELDHVALLRSPTYSALLDGVIDECLAVESTLGWLDDDPDGAARE